MTDAEQTAKRRTPMWIKVLLGLSLALNLAVIGLGVGIVARLKDAPRVAGIVNFGVPYIMALPREDRREIREALRAEEKAGNIPERRARRAQFKAMLALLEAPDWDADAAAEVLQEQGAETKIVQSAAQSAWLAKVSEFSNEERALYAEQLRTFLERRPGRKPEKDRK